MPKLYKNPITDKECQKRTHDKDYGIRGEYYRDQTAIIHSRPFRRLKNKTQVFFAPKDDHVCTRIEHVMHVATVASTICRGLNEKGSFELDEELAYAIGLGHDIGHAPFGHTGEELLNTKLGDGLNFIHEVNSYRVVEYLSNQGIGLNLTYAVKDGIISHNGEKFEQKIVPYGKVKDLDSINNKKHYPSTFEGCIVRMSDKIAYFGRDIEDALVAKYITKSDIPVNIRSLIGETNSDIIDYFVKDVIKSSNRGEIKLSNDSFKLMNELKDFNYKRIYGHPEILSYKEYCKKIIESLIIHLKSLFEKYDYDYEIYSNSKRIIDKVFGRYIKNMKGFYNKEKREKGYTNSKKQNQIIMDFISGMTDVFAIDCMKEISIPFPIDFYKKIN